MCEFFFGFGVKRKEQGMEGTKDLWKMVLLSELAGTE
jgi:hypothetical protein